jgi:hypothetical protein
MVKLSELLKSDGFDVNAVEGGVKLVRHTTEKKIDKKGNKYKMFEDIIDKGYFETFQSLQKTDCFNNCKYIVVFIGIEDKKALFWNVYEKVGEVTPIETPVLPEDFPQELAAETKFQYKFEPLAGFDDLHRSLVIEWTSGRHWHVNFKDEKIIEIRPQGFFKEFPGYLDFTLSFKDLKYLIQNADANPVWKDKLSAVSGIYLILDTVTGDQYVGSASGNEGIWQRWGNYIETGDGGNKELKELLKNRDNYELNFQFTILATLPGHLTRSEVHEYESLYKTKLGSRVFGLNSN